MKRLSLLISVIMITGLSINAQDVIKLKNGNELNGEIKSMDRDVLTIKTDYSDSDFKVKWDKLIYIKTGSKYIVSLSKERIERKKSFKINRDSKYRLPFSKENIERNKRLKIKRDSIRARINATLESHPTNPEWIVLHTDRGDKSVKYSQIVYLKSFNESFISRLSATVDIGLNIAKANNLIQINISSTLGYMTDKWLANGGISVVDSKQDSITRVHRLDADVGFNWFLPNDLYLAASANYFENDELKLDLRSTYKVGLGFFTLRTNKMFLKVEVGAAFNDEKYFIDEVNPIEPNPRTSGEGYFGTEINLFNIGDLNLMSTIIVFPSFTEDGRVRTDFKFEAKYDLPFDLYIKAGTTVNYDNQPAVEGAEYDYVVNTGLGWEL